MVDVGFDKTRLAPPMWPIAMQTTVTGFFITAITTTEVYMKFGFGPLAAPHPEPGVRCGFSAGSGGSKTGPQPV